MPAEKDPTALNAEEEAAILKARENANSFMATFGMPPAAPGTPMSEAKEGEPLVMLAVTNAFRIQIDHHRRVDFPVGTYACPKRLADHWWAKAHGATVLSEAEFLQTLSPENMPPAQRAQLLKRRAEQALQQAMEAAEAAEAAERDAAGPAPPPDEPAAGEKPLPLKGKKADNTAE